MTKLYIKNTLEKSIRSYCKLNEIKDVNDFANRCALQGFNIIKFGTSPMDNIIRENNGIKDIVENETVKKEKDAPSTNGGKQVEEERNVEREQQKESVPREEKKQQVKVRKIQVIKKG